MSLSQQLGVNGLPGLVRKELSPKTEEPLGFAHWFSGLPL